MSNCFGPYFGYGPSTTEHRGLTERSKATRQDPPQWGSAGSGCSPLTAQAIRNVGRRYQQGGLDRALYEKQRPGAAEVLDDSQKQRLIAMVCSSPPEGRARWTVRLVAQEAVKRKLVPRVGRETIRILLLSHDLKPWREKNVGGGRSQ